MTQASFEAAFIAPGEVTPKRLDSNFYRATYRQAAQRAARLPSAPLSSLVKPGTVITYGVIKSVQIESGVPMLRIQNLQSGFADANGAVRISAEQHQGFSRSALSGGEMLIAIGGYVGIAAKYPNDGPIANINQHVAKVDIDLRRANDYYALAYLWSQTGTLLLQRTVTGTVQAGISLGDLRAFALPLPDRRIQDYIGAKVELAERCRAAAEDHWQRAVGLFQSLFAWSAAQFSLTSVPAVAELSGRLDPKYYRREYLDAVREITAWEHGWEPIGDLVAEVSNGIEYRQYCSDGVPYLTVTNVGDGDLDTDGAPRIPVDAPISDRGRIIESDVLVVRTGATIGQAAVVQRDAASAIISSHFIRLRLHKGDLGQGAWLAFFLNTELGKALQFRIAYGAVQPQIGQDELLRLPVPRLKAEVRRALVRGFLSRSVLRAHARRLVNGAKADVEALIEGTLDVQAILAGTLKPPTADDIPELAEDDA